MIVEIRERQHPPAETRPNLSWVRALQSLPVVLAILFNLVMLWPEFSVPVPSLNDDAEHFLFVQRADSAFSGGENPFDNWSPVLELGFPQFFYYQHVPHLAIAVLYRLALKRVSLLILFNLVRYLLMAFLPLTVWWSMRTMGFSAVASIIGAAFSPFISSNYLYGFEYNSYVWRGYGMYTQLWAMHFLFIATACLQRVLKRGTGYIAAILSCSMVVLSDLMYAYMLGIMAAILFLLSLRKGAGT
ncbi:MAG: hypothetical protein JO189_10695 [Deltaproteobacteria bacterium]|nr:hypothetical protein [Deltaproteobacteria bacterium]